MRKSTRLISLLLGLCWAVAGWADVPFTPTTIENGEFVVGTKWYTIKIGANGYVISDNEDASYISLATSTTEYEDADLWCFVGNDTDGYQIYNKQAGVGKVLASPTTMSGTTGATAYVVLKDTSDLTGYTDLWLFADSDDLGDEINGQYMYQKSTTANKVNNRDNILAFWTGGADAGSTLNIEFAETTIEVLASTGSFTSSNSAGTWHAVWQSTAEDPQITLSCGYNNMTTSNDCLVGYVGSQVSSQDYTIATTSDYVIAAYTLDFVMAASNSVTVSGGGQSYTSSSEPQTLSVSGLSEQSAAFNIAGGNYGIVMSNFIVTVRVATVPPEEQFEVFVTAADATVPYRIPAIAQAQNGNLIAVADYRYSGGDIGSGELDLRGRISKDNGATWGDIFTIVRGSDYTDTSTFMHTGFGDPAIVADRESNRVLLMSCTGAVMYPSGTRNNHQGIARFYSEDGGETWSTPTDISETIYSQFDACEIGTANSMFIGSGRVFQSSTVKVGEYYRLYCAVLFKDVNSVEKNYVLYSDNFGESWSILGGVNVAPIPSGANEPKTEELPDGSILVSSRCTGGRYYNIFNFTNSAAAEGSWGTMAFSGSSNDGVTATSNSCNGEVMILPARRTSDGQGVYVALQSVPFGSGRTNVGIHYKELESLADFDTATNFAKDWDGKHQASYLGSAYSTMTLQQDSTIGFLYEEETYGTDYTIVYKNYTLAYITDSAYVYDPTIVKDSVVNAGMPARYAALDSCFGTFVGNLVADAKPAVTAAYNAYAAAPSKDLYEAFNAAVANADRVEIEAGKLYRLRNYERADATMYLLASTSALGAATIDEESTYQLFEFIADEDEEGLWYVRNEGAGVYIGRTPAVYSAIPVTTSASYAYSVSSSMEGLSALICDNPTNSSYPAIHLNSSYSLVPWTSTSEGSLWYIEPTDIVSAIESAEIETNEEPETFYDLSGRKVEQLKKGVYVTNKRRKVYVK